MSVLLDSGFLTQGARQIRGRHPDRAAMQNLLLAPTLTVGDPDVAGPLAVFPVFGPPPRLEYVSYAEAAAQGAAVTELPHGASVNDVLVHNPLPLPFLLYEGEELKGAQQDRTVDAAVLVPAGATIKVAVSCVEHGRWDGSRHAEPFAPSSNAAFPSLRAAKSRRMRERLAGGLEARADQHEVWQTVAERSDALAAPSATGAMGDAFKHRARDISPLRDAVTRRDGQLGTIVAFAGTFAVVDLVSRPDVFAALHGPLVSGYALDALDRRARPAPATADAQALLATLAAEPVSATAGAGLGETVHFVSGTGLMHDDELIQLSAFIEEPRRARRIRRPSQRGQ